ncbi:MaoC family dehydratase N-terminal domain-containing protein [Oceanimonas sp. NS1]|nr:MaoC family dehydratase N-terminal domain-containing protein [Oceanimonas sp. NS1]
MWAGGRFEFLAPLRMGEPVRKVSTISNITHKEGRTGALCFVTVLHEIYSGSHLAFTEEQDIVYREDPAADAPQPAPKLAPDDADVVETVSPTEVMLYRYSALTFNGHRIHYDVDYSRDVEGYEGLVFHGPLTATLLVDLATRTMGRQPARFSFKGLAPITANHSFKIEGRREGNVMKLWARRHDNALAMQAEAVFLEQ